MRLLTAFEFCYIASKNELVLKEKFKAKFELIYGRLYTVVSRERCGAGFLF